VRVGVDAHVLTGKHQGSRTWLHQILAEIDRQGPPDNYLVFSGSPAEVTRLTGARCLAHRTLPRRPASLRLLWTWQRLAAREDLDALITQYNAPLWGAGKQIVVVHDILFETHPHFFAPPMRRRLQVLTRQSVRRAALVVTVSEYSRRQIAERYGVSDERMVVCPNGATPPMPPDTQATSRAEALAPYVLMVGRIEPRKNVDLVLRATQGLRRRGATLVLVGKADHASARTMAAVERADDVLHLQDVPGNELAELYRHAAALVFASSAEGFGLPVLEALVYGTPVVASDRTSIPEVAGPFARFFNPDGPRAVDALAEALADVMDSRPRLDEAALTRHLATFNWADSASTLIAAVHRLGSRA
jgi:glycosyltransferase involved in cell wall biosynthesis